MKSKILLSLALLVGCSILPMSNAGATYWNFVVTNANTSENWYVDTDSIIKDNDEAICWVKGVAPNGKYQVFSVWIHKNGFFRILATYNYDAHGTAYEMSTAMSDVLPIPPHSIIQVVKKSINM